MKQNRIIITAGLLGILLIVTTLRLAAQQNGQAITKAICVLYSTTGNTVSGTVTFLQVEKGIRVLADIKGLTPGKHGFHIHQFGDCSSADGTSAGGHFNPHGMEHGSPMAEMRHIGDLGNLVADENGIAHLDYIDTQISFDAENNIIGRSIVVHASEDDLKTQPTGAAGARVACGSIGIAKIE